MLGVTTCLILLTVLNLHCVQGGWRSLTAQYGVWKDTDGDSWSYSMAAIDSRKWHYGPARVWTTPVNSDQYEVTSKVLTSGSSNGDCGHIFKYKAGSTRSKSMVTKAWGYFLWQNKLMYITSNGKESSPSINYIYKRNHWYNLKTVVNGANVKIYIDNKLVKQVTMTGAEATSKTNNYVGLWCHSGTNDKGKNFRVKILSERYNNPNNQLKCSSNHMQITIPRSSFPFILAQDLRLNQPSCGATEDNKNFYLKTAFDKCGTTATKTSTSITYSNHVLGRPLNSSAVISRIHDINITISCSYQRHKDLTSFHLKPNKTKTITAFQSKGKFNFSLKVFPSNQFRSPYSKYPVNVELRQVVYIQVSVRSIGQELSVLAQQCYATPSRNGEARGAPKYWLIKDSCSVDPTLKILKSPTKSIQRFSVQAFRFVGKHRHAYFHCHVIACNGNDVRSVCSRGCNKRRKIGKRSEKSSAVILTQGPVDSRELDPEKMIQQM